MEIFIGNLPKQTVVSELNEFFRGFGRTAYFSILEKVMEDGRTLRFGYGVIEPDWAGIHAVRRLNHKKLHGRPLTIREYVHRSLDEDDRDGNPPDRRRVGRIRITDRREPGRFRPVPTSWR